MQSQSILQNAFHEGDPSFTLAQAETAKLKDDTHYPSDALVPFATIAHQQRQNAGEWIERHLMAYDHLKPTGKSWGRLEGLLVFGDEENPELIANIVKWVLQSKQFKDMMRGGEAEHTRYIDLTIQKPTALKLKSNPRVAKTVLVEFKRVKNSGISFWVDIETEEFDKLKPVTAATNGAQPRKTEAEATL